MVGCAAQILFKKRMFRETDETITEPQFVTLSYVQVHALSAGAPLLQPRSFLGPWLCSMHMQRKGDMPVVLAAVPCRRTTLLHGTAASAYRPGVTGAQRSAAAGAGRAQTQLAVPATLNPAHACTAQAQHDYLSGNYPVVREDAAQMASLQMQAEAGSCMLDAPELVEGAVERFVTKQARRRALPAQRRAHALSRVARHP